MTDDLLLVVTRVCVEKLHRAPEECSDVHWSTIWRLTAIAQQEYEDQQEAMKRHG